MSQILDPIPNDNNGSILCCYVNATSQIQVARITNISNWYFERVVFPGQRLAFEALPEALLEIHTGMMASAIISDTIPCKKLFVNDSNDSNHPQDDAVKASENRTTNNRISSNNNRITSKSNVAKSEKKIKNSTPVVSLC